MSNLPWEKIVYQEVGIPVAEQDTAVQAQVVPAASTPQREHIPAEDLKYIPRFGPVA